ARQDDLLGAQPVLQPVEPGAPGLARAGALLRVLPIRLDLLAGGHDARLRVGWLCVGGVGRGGDWLRSAAEVPVPFSTARPAGRGRGTGTDRRRSVPVPGPLPAPLRFGAWRGRRAALTPKRHLRNRGPDRSPIPARRRGFPAR